MKYYIFVLNKALKSMYKERISYCTSIHCTEITNIRVRSIYFPIGPTALSLCTILVVSSWSYVLLQKSTRERNYIFPKTFSLLCSPLLLFPLIPSICSSTRIFTLSSCLEKFHFGVSWDKYASLNIHRRSFCSSEPFCLFLEEWCCRVQNG